MDQYPQGGAGGVPGQQGEKQGEKGGQRVPTVRAGTSVAEQKNRQDENERVERNDEEDAVDRRDGNASGEEGAR
ncbi:hypothetical protein [Kitasatospora sp. NPDC059571]|uniref:hypothetical protein n=1 Tax=Kitasatospora sp. NPDC059571 TaxID=3346871 RepID=UPI0036C86043